MIFNKGFFVALSKAPDCRNRAAPILNTIRGRSRSASTAMSHKAKMFAPNVDCFSAPAVWKGSSNEGSSNSKTRTCRTVAMAAVGAASAIAAAMDSRLTSLDNDIQNSTFAMPDMPKMKSSGTALAQKLERQKVILSRLLSEFHQVVEEQKAEWKKPKTVPTQANEQGPCSMSHLKAISKRNTTGGKISKLMDVHEDVSELAGDPERIWEIIGQMRDGGLLRRKDLMRLTKQAASVLRNDPTVIDLRGRKDIQRITVVGDLHGHFNSLFDVLSIVGDPSSNDKGQTGTPWDGSGIVIFNGDFVDRGDNSLDVLMTLLLLKVAYPDHIYLNRGNHEDGVLATVYGYIDELKARYNDNRVDDIWACFEEVFSALPLCVRTETAAIMHGGIPSDGFLLNELEDITSEQRSQYKSLLEPGDDRVAQLLQNVTWSDPRPVRGVHPNEDRGAGMHFGPDVLRRFLSDHNLQCLIRSHEIVEDGYEHLPCGDEHSVITVFSASSYPNGTGFNYGAVIRLSPDGSLEPVPYPGESHKRPLLAYNTSVELFEPRTLEALAEVIADHRMELEDQFQYIADGNHERRRLINAFTSFYPDKRTVEKRSTLITREQWAECMSLVLDLPHMDWLSLQPYLAPSTLDIQETEKRTRPLLPDDNYNTLNNSNTDDGNGTIMASSSAVKNMRTTDLIDYTQFLETFGEVIAASSRIHLDCDTTKHVDLSQQKHDKLLAVFEFLDMDGNGTIDRNKFKRGMDLLRKRFPENNLQEADEIFNLMDVDGNGAMDFETFERAFLF